MQPTESEIFLVVIPRKGNSEVLLVREDDRFALPQVTIPKWERTAEYITERVLDLWRLPTICLFRPTLKNISHETVHQQYVVLEPRDKTWEPRRGLHWISRSELQSRLRSPIAIQRLEEILDESDSYDRGSLPGAFAKTGWFDHFISLVKKDLNSIGLTLTGNVRQFTGHPSYTLLRLETDGPAIWFKAVGPPNLHEYAVTISLTKMFPAYFPTVMRAYPEWRGWLSKEAPGVPLRQIEAPEKWAIVASTLGRLQREVVTSGYDLQGSECKDLRISTVVELIDPFLAVAKELMIRQTTKAPPPLSHQDLVKLAAQLKRVCDRYLETGIPDSFGHCDFNLGNVFVDSESCTFLDLADAFVGPPFITFEYLRLQFCMKFPSNHSFRARLTDAYLEHWRDLLSEEQMRAGLYCTGPLAVLCYALSTQAWRSTDRLRDPFLGKCYRSLTRRMLLESTRPEVLSIL
jgi:hypothetical protein